MTQVKNQPTTKRSVLLPTLLFLSPSLILLVVFFIGPVIMTVFFSFTDFSLTGTTAREVSYVGFDNFTNLFKDHRFFSSVNATWIFLLASGIIGQQLLGFVVAFLMQRKNKLFRKVVGATIMAGWVTPELIVAISFVTLLHDGGTVNALLGSLGFNPISWLYEYPMISVVIANIWQGSALSMLMFQSALDSIPDALYEAAEIDGAGPWKRLLHVTLPVIKGTIFTNLVIITLSTLGVFTLLYTMTGGGPVGRTSTLPVFMYEQAFVNYRLGYGTAIALVILVFGILLSLIYIRLLRVKND